jgi:hypothetical protein
LVRDDNIDADEIYEERVREVEDNRKKEKSWTSKLTPEIKVAIILAVGGGGWYVMTHPEMNKWQAAAVALFVVFAIWLWLQGDVDPKKLTEAQTAAFLYKHLKLMQRTQMGDKPRLEPGRIRVTVEGKEVSTDGRPWKRVHSFTLTDAKGVPKMYSAEVNIWDGEPMGFQRRLSGFTGAEIERIKILPGKDLRDEMQRQKWMAKAKRDGQQGG